MNHSAAITKNQILSNFFNDPNLNKMLAKFNAGAGNEDLKAELFSTLCHQPEEKIQHLYQAKELLYFATGIVQRMIFQPKSKFHRTYRSANSEFNDSIEVPVEHYDTEKDQRDERVIENIDKNLHWVESALMRIYLKEGSVQRAAKTTGISVGQVSNILKNARSKMSTVYNGKTFGSYVVANMELVLDVNSEVNPETVIDLMEEVQEYIAYRLNGNKIPTKSNSDAFIKEIKPIRIKKVI